MGRARRLSESEKATSKAQAQHGMKHNEIAKIVGRRRTTNTEYMMSLTKVQLPKKLGRPAILCERNKRQIMRHATMLQQSATTIKREMNLKVGFRRIQQVLHEASNIAYMKRHNSTCLQFHHLESRLKWAR